MNHKVLAEGVMEDDWDNATFILNVALNIQTCPGEVLPTI